MDSCARPSCASFVLWQVNKKEAEINALQSQIEDHGERIQALRDHRKNVLQELNQTQALYEARRRDHQTEDHMKQIGV